MSDANDPSAPQIPPGPPATKRAVAFVDGQNLFNAAKTHFGYRFPNYDIKKLTDMICRQQGWVLSQARFYTGIPHPKYDVDRNHFWQGKLLAMKRSGVETFSRQLVYRKEIIVLEDGEEIDHSYSQEKGIDVRIAVDIIRLALSGAYDVALIFSQDQDLSEAVVEIKAIAKEQNRWMIAASAYPFGGNGNTTAIGGCVPIKIDRGTYDACIDPTDYRPRRGPHPSR